MEDEENEEDDESKEDQDDASEQDYDDDFTVEVPEGELMQKS